VLLKNVDVFYCDRLVKVNVKQQKFVCLVDLEHEIDEEAKENKVQLLESHLEIYLRKKEVGMWQHV